MIRPGAGIAVALMVAVLFTAVLFRGFRRRSIGLPCAILATYALVLGSLVALAGVAHTVAIATAARGRPYDSRPTFLLTVGGILVSWGLLNAVLSPFLNRAKPWSAAVVGASICALIVFLVFLLLWVPLPSAGESVKDLFVLSTIYLLLLAWCWSFVRGSVAQESAP
jgi:hypothetical protein